MEPRSHPPTLKELRAQRNEVRNANKILAEKLKPLDRVAIWITEHVGSMGFFLIIFGWTAIWLGWNTLAPKSIRFDPFPAFVLWLFIANMIQLLLMPLIMVGQVLQNRHSEARAESDYEVNVKAEQEIEAILFHLESQAESIEKILQGMAQGKRP